MREEEDVENIPKNLKQYAWEYFRAVELNKEQLRRLAIYVADKLYRVIMGMTIVDNYTRTYFVEVIPYLWDAIQNRGVDLFYILDNTLREDRFQALIELFALTGMAVVTPYTDNGNLGGDAVGKRVKDCMASTRMIIYVEKNANVNYLQKVIRLARSSSYTVAFRNNGPEDSNITMFEE